MAGLALSSASSGLGFDLHGAVERLFLDRDQDPATGRSSQVWMGRPVDWP
jgi:hypothetical protein